MKRTKIIEQYTSVGENIYGAEFRLNMYRLVLHKPITYKTIKLERHEE